MDGSVSGAAAASPAGQEQIADAVQQTTGFSPMTEPADAPHPALREDHIQNAVAFLAHPKVRGSSVDSKRSFLEKKGLTEQEIAEAFKRVPETPNASVPAAPSGLPVNPSAAPPKPYPTATADTLQQLQPAPLQQPQRQPIRWTQVVIGVGMLAALSYAVKQFVAPRVSQWYHDWRHDADKAKAEEDQQKTAQLVATAIQSQTAEVQKTLESLKDALTTLEKGRAPVEVARDSITLTDLRSELRVLASSLNEFSSPAKAASGEGEDEKLDELRALMSTMVQQMQQLPDVIKPSMARSASFGAAGSQHGQSAFAAHAAHGLPNKEPIEPSALTNGDTPSQPPHPASYMEVLEMLENGETPPNIRTDIKDEPPNPTAVPSNARMKPRPKPWERSAAPASSSAFPAFASGGSGGSAFPPASRAALSPRDAPAEGVGESTDMPADSATNGLAQITEVPAASPHDAASSSSSPARVALNPAAAAWRPPAVPQPSLPRPVESLGKSSSANSIAGASSQQPAELDKAVTDREEPSEAGSSTRGAGIAEAEAGSSA